MFRAFQSATRRAASSSNLNPASTTTTKSSAVAATVALAALAALATEVRKHPLQEKEEHEHEHVLHASDSFSERTRQKLGEAIEANLINVLTRPTPELCQCEPTAAFRGSIMPDCDLRLRRAVTSRRMAAEAARRSFFSLYEVDFDHPLGSGAYGDVYLCRELASGEECALKKIPKEFTEDVEFQREMNALLHIRANGGHPNICMLRENFDEKDDYLLVLDLVLGKEMFDHLIEHGAYSEADASRLLRQVASALDFIHGIGVVHADLKPENIMLRSARGDSVIKLIDFGCSEVLSHPEEEDSGIRLPSRNLSHAEGATTAYCPPEAFDDDTVKLDPSADMWALGVIAYMMLLGRHPFDLDCNATDDEIAARIKEQRQPPLKDCPFAGHLSPSALDLLSKLMEPDPKKRMTAHDMLHHPWVMGQTARHSVMEDSVTRLKTIHKYKSGIERSVIESLLSFSDEEEEHPKKSRARDNRTSLLERAWDQIDKDKKGFLTRDDLRSLRPVGASLIRRLTSKGGDDDDENQNLSFSHFSDLVGQNMRSVHFPRGHVIYNEGDDGDYMYFINSGTIEVTTNDGFRTKKGQGDYFGKGGVLGRKRRTTITCTTPVNVLRIDKAMFKKYIIKGSPLALKLREKINTERFDRGVRILENNCDMKQKTYRKGDVIFQDGDKPHEAYILKDGLIHVNVGSHHIYSVKPGHLFGVQSFVMQRDRKAAAVCKSDNCVVKSVPLGDVQDLFKKFPELRSTIRELALRLEFRRAVVQRSKKSFPRSAKLKELFDEIDLNRSGTLDANEVRTLMKNLGVNFTDDEIVTLMKTLDLNESGEVDFHEFESIFGKN